jgi:hypothetical protein
MTKKFWIGFVVVFVVVAILDSIVNMVLMMSVYRQTASLWRPEGEIMTWLVFVCYVSFAFFFTLIYAKGHEGKGPMEGVRYGVYVTGLMTVPAAYMTYATMPVPYPLALQWFIYGLIENVIAGIILTLIYGKVKARPAAVA